MMCPPSTIFCFLFLLIASFSESQKNFTNGDEQSNNSRQYDSLVNFMKNQNEEINSTQYNSHENSIKNNNKIQYDCINSTKNDCKNDSILYKSCEHITKNREENNETSTESCANSTGINDLTLEEINENFTKTEDKSNSTLYIYGNFYTVMYSNRTATIVSYEECGNITCIPLCCPRGQNLTRHGICIDGQSDALPTIYRNNSDSEDSKLDELVLTIRDPCVLQGLGRSLSDINEFSFFADGSLYHRSGVVISPTFYCLASMFRSTYDVIICNNESKLSIYVSVWLLVSLPFLLLTFIVYSILPELQNMHSYTLRAHIGSLFITYTIMYFGQQVSGLGTASYCVALAYIFNFFFLSSFFWLNVTCFDIWWTFRVLRLRRTSVKRDKKRFVIYSIYAWGITFILNVICAVMDIIPGENLIRPEICKRKFWFGENVAKTLYFYVPMGATIICNIFFFVTTTLTIMYQNIHTSQQLKHSESKRHDENKQRLYMYLKLFIVMGITWISEILAWTIGVDFVPAYVWYPTTIINALQGLIIFIIFVCTKKIKQMLLKRFGGQSCGPFKIPISDSIASNTTSVTTSGSGTMPMQEISPSNS